MAAAIEKAQKFHLHTMLKLVTAIQLGRNVAKDILLRDVIPLWLENSTAEVLAC